MDDIKLFARNETELETLIQTIRIYSQDIEIEFGIEKCAMLIMKSRKRQIMERKELPNQEGIRTLREKENYKYLGILNSDTIKQVEMKEKLRNEFLRKMKKLLETKFCSRNLTKRINTRAVLLVSYMRPFLKWTREELGQMDQRTRKLMMHKPLHLRDVIDGLYVSRKEGEEDLTALKIVWMHRYKDLRTMLKRTKKD